MQLAADCQAAAPLGAAAIIGATPALVESPVLATGPGGASPGAEATGLAVLRQWVPSHEQRTLQVTPKAAILVR